MSRSIRKEVTRRPICASAAAVILLLGLGAAFARLHEREGQSGPRAWRAAHSAEASLSARGISRLRRTTWQGGRVVAKTGEALTVYVSDAYPDTAAPQRWADYFASLVHGAELSSLTVYVAAAAEVGSLCDGAEVLGCYGGDRIVITGEPVDEIPPEAVAAHEYGHHVAANRANPPWSPVDWGPKRWASYEHVCSRAHAGTAFPGDEGLRYFLNPGEAFAESFRVLNQQALGAAVSPWKIVDHSFTPDAGALGAIREDVLQPWTPPPPQAVRARFAARGPRTWTLRLATPLDGQLSVLLTVPAGAVYDLSLRGADGRVLETGLLSGSGEKTLEHAVCDERTAQLRVTRHGPAGRFSLRIQRP
jgi:hypothetical protein